MKSKPTGRVIRTEAGHDLVLTRQFRAPIEDVWASITEPERTARWFGPWYGEGGVGRRIRYRMVFEKGGETMEPAEMTIEACDPPRHLALSAVDDYGSWFLELDLTEADGVTELRFAQHLDDATDVGAVGPGWEYYLDNLVASREGAAMPDFNDYYPSQSDYFRDQMAGTRG